MTEDFSEKIDAYLQGKLPTGEQADFEKLLAENPAIARETTLRQAEMHAIERLIEQDLRREMANLETEIAQPPQKKGSKIWLAAAVALLVFSVGFYFFQKKMNPPPPASPAEPTKLDPSQSREPVAETPAEIPKNEPAPSLPKIEKPKNPAAAPRKFSVEKIAALATPSNLQTFVRGQQNTAEPPDDFEKAAEAFDRRDFAAALRFSENLPAARRPETWWLRGHVFFQQKKYALAAREFQQLAAAKTDLFRDRDEWMCLLSLVAERGLADSATAQILRKIEADDAHPFQSDARKLREILK